MQSEHLRETSTRFKHLDLSENQLTECPNVYTVQRGFGWHELVELDLSNNQLKSIQKEVFEMESLEDLNLSHNRIEIIPENIFFSLSLRVLELDHNELQTLPSSLSDSAISYLDLSYNRFTTSRCLPYEKLGHRVFIRQRKS